MATLPEIDPKQEPEAAATFAQVEASRGWVSNLMRAIAHAPEDLRLYAALGHYSRYGTALTEVQRELAICATVRGVDYGWTHHSNLARQIGVSDAQLASLRAGCVPDVSVPPAFSPNRAFEISPLCGSALGRARRGGVSAPHLDHHRPG